MCIAIYKPVGKSISKETLAACFQNNSDGAGFAYINTDHFGKRKIKIKKSMVFEDFYKKYKRALGIATESPFLIHFRIGTHGIKSTHNVHPFMVDKSLCFMHNGIINHVSRHAKDSDTQMFNQEVLQLLPKGWEYNKGIEVLLKQYLGASKIITLNLEGDTTIYGESMGHWVDGVWYSNKTYEIRVPVVYSRAAVTTLPRYNAWTTDSCEYCNNTGTVRTMFPYRTGGQVILLCKACKKDLTVTSQISEKESMPLGEYLAYMNSFGSITDYPSESRWSYM